MNGNDINSAVDNVAAKIGVAADKVYPMLLKQAYIDGLMNLVWVILGIIMVTVCLIYWYKITSFVLRKRASGDEDSRRYGYDWSEYWREDTMRIIWTILVSLSGLIFFFVLLANIDPAVSILSNPEWYAWQKILQYLKR